MQLLCRIIKEKPANEQETVLELKYQPQCTEFEIVEEELLDETQQAQKLAKKIISEAESSAKNIKDLAYEEGLQQGQLEATGIIDKTYSQTTQLLSEIDKYRQCVLEQLKSELCELTVEIAQKIIKAEVSLNNDVISNIVLDAVDRVKNRKKVNIFVNPRDLNFVEQIREKIKHSLNEARLEVIPDPLIKIGGCRIHTETGWIDATIDNQLKELEKILKL